MIYRLIEKKIKQLSHISRIETKKKTMSRSILKHSESILKKITSLHSLTTSIQETMIRIRRFINRHLITIQSRYEHHGNEKWSSIIRVMYEYFCIMDNIDPHILLSHILRIDVFLGRSTGQITKWFKKIVT